MGKVKVAILGTGNIGTDLMYKILKSTGDMELSLMAGIDPESEGIARAKRMGVRTSHEGIAAILDDDDIKIVFDATSAKAHIEFHAEPLRKAGKIAIDLTPGAVGPFVVPTINLEEHLEALNVNLISCGGQATTPLVYAINRIVPVHYAEVIATASSVSIGPGTRQNVDEFVQTTALCYSKGRWKRQHLGRFLFLIQPEPPINMTNTVYAVIKEDFDEKGSYSSRFNL